MDQSIKNIIDAMNDIMQDSATPKNVQTKMQEVIAILQKEEEKSIKIDKALNALDELAEDSNLQPYTRTQIWNIISSLESA